MTSTTAAGGSFVAPGTAQTVTFTDPQSGGVDTVDVTTAPPPTPTALALFPATATAAAGSDSPTFTLELDHPAPAGGTTVQFVATSGLVYKVSGSAATQAVIPQGETLGSFTVNAAVAGEYAVAVTSSGLLVYGSPATFTATAAGTGEVAAGTRAYRLDLPPEWDGFTGVGYQVGVLANDASIAWGATATAGLARYSSGIWIVAGLPLYDRPKAIRLVDDAAHASDPAILGPEGPTREDIRDELDFRSAFAPTGEVVAVTSSKVFTVGADFAAVADKYKAKDLIFLDGAALGDRSAIAAYTAARQVTLATAPTATPAPGDKVAIVDPK